MALSALSRQMARLRLAPTSSTRGAVPSCTREGKRRSTGRGTASGSVWKKSSASSRAPCGRQTQVRELPPYPHTCSPLLQVPPHLSWSWGPCAQVSGVLVPCGQQPVAVSLLQEVFSAECSGCVAAWATLILQHKRVLGTQAQEAAQQPASRSRSTTELRLEPSLAQGSSAQPSPASSFLPSRDSTPAKPWATGRHCSPCSQAESGSIPTDTAAGLALPVPSCTAGPSQPWCRQSRSPQR